MKRLTVMNPSKINRKTWLFLFKDLAELCPSDNPSFEEEQAKLKEISGIVSRMTGAELNAFADSMRTKMEYQLLYRDGHWLDNPEQYNHKTQLLIDHILADLQDYRTEVLTNNLAKAIKKSFA